jgi:hypothetical protein
MIQNNENKQTQVQTPGVPAPKRPNETGSIQVEGHVRIFDPASKEVYVEKRA